MSKVPSQTRAALCGSRISAAHFPQGLCLTPLYLLLVSPVSTGETIPALLDGVNGTAVPVAVTALPAVVTVCVSSSVTVSNYKDI